MVTKVIIDGHFYDQSAKETAKELGVNYSTLMDRVKSNDEKWKNWKVADLNLDILINGRKYADIDSAIFALLDFKHRIHKATKGNTFKS